MGEIFGPALVIGVIVFVAGMGAYFIGRLRQGKKRNVFAEYLAGHIPGAGTEFLMASRVSKSGAFDIGLAVDEGHRQLAVLSKEKGQVSHKLYPFSTLAAVESADEVISRGLPSQRTYSFQRTMTLAFEDGSSYPFVLETISNKHGTKGTEVVTDAFRPWEVRLDAIVGESKATLS